MRFRLALTAAALVTGLSVSTSFAQATDSPKMGDDKYKPSVGQSGKDVIWVPTNDAVADAMLKMANVKPGDLVFDLGAGDGKIAIAAAKNYGATAVGIGRPYCWGLGAFGQAGVERVIDLLNREFAICMRGSGTISLAAIDASYVQDTGQHNPDSLFGRN